MLERFTDDARQVLVQAQAAARRLGHDFIGCEHLLLAAASTGTPASLVLRDQGVSPERIEKEILHILGPGRTADLLGGLDREALASIGIELERRPYPARGRVRPGRPRPGRPGLPPEPPASLGKGPGGRADAPSAAPSRPRQRRAAARPRAPRPRPALPGSGTGRPYSVHATGQEEPGALPARGRGAERQPHRCPAPRPRPADHERGDGAGDPVGPRRIEHSAARRHPRPLPESKLIPRPNRHVQARSR